MWQPAVAAPVVLGNWEYHHTKVIDSLNLVDYIFVAYHREVVEMLHPFVQEYDRECTIASQVIQSLEISLAYRGHQLLISNLELSNGLHRPYPLECDVAIDKLFQFHKETTPPLLKHCVFDNVHQFYNQFTRGSVVGLPLPQIKHYFLHGAYHGMHTSLFLYSMQIQWACQAAVNVNKSYWDPKDTLCCSIDNSDIHIRYGAEMMKRLLSGGESGRIDIREIFPRHNMIESVFDIDRNFTSHYFVYGDEMIFMDRN